MKTRPLAILSALAIAISLSAPVIAEEALGRLFFTPERRQQLDHQRQFNLQEQREIAEDPTLTINGVVTRSSGKRTVWINGVAHDGRETGQGDQGVWVTPDRARPGKIIVQPEGSTAANANVGDTVNRSTGEATGLLQGGWINIRTTPPQ